MKTNAIPTLDEILAYRAPPDADLPTLQAAIGAADTARNALISRRQAVHRQLKGPALELTDREAESLRREVDNLDLAIRRFDELLPAMKEPLGPMIAKGWIEALRREGGEAHEACDRLNAWYRDTYPKIAQLVGEGYAAFDQAVRKQQAFVANVTAAYKDPDVRACGPLGVAIPKLPASSPPYNLFPGFYGAQT